MGYFHNLESHSGIKKGESDSRCGLEQRRLFLIKAATTTTTYGVEERIIKVHLCVCLGIEDILLVVVILI